MLTKFSGIPAEEVLYACEENESNCNVSSEVGLANPAVHFFRWVIKLFAKKNIIKPLKQIELFM